MLPKEIRQSNFHWLTIFILLLSAIITTQAYAQKIPKLFAPSAFQGSSSPLADIFGADFDNGGHIDLVATYDIDPDIILFFNDENEGISQIINLNPDVEAADLLNAVEGADLDNDGDIDLVSATRNGFFGVAGDENTVAVNLNNGDRTFQNTQLHEVLSESRLIFLSDFNIDSYIDIAANHRDTSDISIILNNGNGTFAPYKSYPITAIAATLFGVDIDNDGDVDLITADSSQVIPLLNDGNGGFTTGQPILLAPFIKDIKGDDLDKDGDIDLIAANSFTKEMTILTNDGNSNLFIYNIFDYIS